MREGQIGTMLLSLLLVGGAAGTSGAQDLAACSLNKTAPAIKGTYIDNFGGVQSISESYWTSSSLVFEICSVDNARKRIIAQNDSRNQFNPGKFSRFEWTNFGNRLWYCQSVYDAPTATAADAAAPADPSNPVDGGCGGQFAWSTLIRILP
jgi:hypothetical protein